MPLLKWLYFNNNGIVY